LASKKVVERETPPGLLSSEYMPCFAGHHWLVAAFQMLT
jgi:hypothetical protein